jgi:hypothetical protein
MVPPCLALGRCSPLLGPAVVPPCLAGPLAGLTGPGLPGPSPCLGYQRQLPPAWPAAGAPCRAPAWAWAEGPPRGAVVWPVHTPAEQPIQPTHNWTLLRPAVHPDALPRLVSSVPARLAAYFHLSIDLGPLGSGPGLRLSSPGSRVQWTWAP